MAWAKFVRVWVAAFCGVTVLVAAGCANPLADLGSEAIESEPVDSQRSSGEQAVQQGDGDRETSDGSTDFAPADGEEESDASNSDDPTDTTAPPAETAPSADAESSDDSTGPDSDATIWAVTFNPGTASQLWQVSASGEELIGSISNESGADLVLADIAASPSGELYAMDFNELYLIDASDPDSIIATSIGPHGVNGGNALTFSNDGELFAAGTQGLFEIDPSSGRSSPISSIDRFRSSGDLAAGADGLFGTVDLDNQPDPDGDVLVRFDLSTDSMTALAELPGEVYALALAGDRLYGMRIASDNGCAGELLDIDPTNGSFTIVRCLPFQPGGATTTYVSAEKA